MAGRGEQFMDWLAAHWRVVLGVFGGLLAGAVIGWVLGSYSACRDSGCKVRVDSVEAIGTWVGGLGTIAAVLAAVVAFRSEEAARRAQELRLMLTRVEQEQQDRLQVEQVLPRARVRMTVGDSGERYVLNFDLGVVNNTNTTNAYKVRWESARYGKFRERPKLAPSEHWKERITLGGESPSGPRPRRMPAPANLDAWEADMVTDVTIEFEMNGQRWRRIGFQPPELLGPSLP
jgi:hypothetical protein